LALEQLFTPRLPTDSGFWQLFMIAVLSIQNEIQKKVCISLLLGPRTATLAALKLP
jgi:hypothetical protein